MHPKIAPHTHWAHFSPCLSFEKIPVQYKLSASPSLTPSSEQSFFIFDFIL
jgi:hypothetical protein